MDRWAIETLGIAGVVLMENAGRQIADAVDGLLGGAGRRRVAIVAGAGNNGGDGFVAARHLTMRGVEVVTFLVAPSGKVSGDAAVNLGILRKLGGDVRELTGAVVAEMGDSLSAADVVVDAVGGTGIRGALRGDAAETVRQINAADRPVVAVDIPTGLDCDTGEPTDPTVKATVTVTFVAPKAGYGAPSAAAYLGEVRVADIGVPAEAAERLGPAQ